MDVEWKKSSRSGAGGGNCVEVAELPTTMKIRDSKNPHGGTLEFRWPAWSDFIDAVKNGEFDL